MNLVSPAGQGHACLIYDDEERRLHTLARFVRAGLEADERVLYVGSRVDGERVEAAVAAAGRRPKRGRFDVEAVERVYLANGSFDPDRMVDVVRAEAAAAADAGFTALRIAGDMSWAADGIPGSDRLIEYERKVHDVLCELGVHALCEYDRRLQPAPTLFGALETHGRVLYGLAGDERVSVDHERGRLAVSGWIEVANVGVLADALREAEPDELGLRVDLSHVLFIDVAGLRVLHAAAERLSRDGKYLALEAPPPPVPRVVAILGWQDLDFLRIVNSTA